jgi:hypothetical protein
VCVAMLGNNGHWRGVNHPPVRLFPDEFEHRLLSNPAMACVKVSGVARMGSITCGDGVRCGLGLLRATYRRCGAQVPA